MNYPDQNRRKLQVDLVVADVALRSSLRMLLSVSGMEVREHRTARAYLATRPATRGCLVVDIQLADMRDRRFCIELVELSRHIPVVVLTSAPEDFELARCMSPNIRVIGKPFTSELLVDAVAASAGAVPVEEHEDRTPLDATQAVS